MVRIQRMSGGLVWLTLCLFLFGCESRDLDAVGETETPLVILLSPFHATDTEQIDTLTNYIEAETGLAITVRVAPSEEVAVSIAGTYQFDIGILPLFDYLFCHREYGVQAGLQVLREDGARTYRGEILVQTDSDITEIAQLEGKRIAYVDSFSTSGFLFPASLLINAGVTPVTVFAGTHDLAVAQLREGEVDSAATYEGFAADATDLRSVATTEEIPNEPVFFRADLAAETRQRVIEALVGFSQTEDGRLVLSSIADITGFTVVTDAVYAEVDTAIAAAGHTVQDLVPNGWWTYNENRLTPADYAP